MSVEGALPRCKAVVAIPVRNEAERIAACLDALASQTGVDARELGIVLFLNNCTDDTAAIVERAQAHVRVPLRVINRNCADANAGWARREAMEASARWLEEAGACSGVILTTDADSRVPTDWVARNLSALSHGVDAVAGQIELDAADASRLPAALHARGQLEGTYGALLAELESLIDPIPHDPWPRHWTTSGATLAVRLDAYRRVGGMPPLALGEDRAFVSSLLTSDARVRHDPSITVTTSGRLQGRAEGGAADTMRLRCEVPESPCDFRLEALPRALFRYAWRRRLRQMHAQDRISRHHLWAPWLGLKPETAQSVAAPSAFGAVLASVERTSPLLTYNALRPASLPFNIMLARAALALLRCRAQLRTAFRSLVRTGAWSNPPARTEQGRT